MNSSPLNPCPSPPSHPQPPISLLWSQTLTQGSGSLIAERGRGYSELRWGTPSSWHLLCLHPGSLSSTLLISHACVLSCFSSFQLFATPWTVARQAPLSVGFSRQEHWIGFPFPSPGDLPSPGIKPRSPALQADSLSSEPPGNQKRHPRRKPSDCPSRAGSCLPTALSTPQACCVLLLPFRVLLSRVILMTVEVS